MTHDTPTGRDSRLWLNDRWVAWPDLEAPSLPSRCVALTDSQEAALTHVWAAVRDRTELLLTTPSRADADLREELSGDGFAIVIDGRTERAGDDVGTSGRLWLTTSGSTGRPKRVAHTLQSLTTVTAPQPPRTWLLPYSPGTYAWWQLVTLSLGQPRQNLVPVDSADLDRWPGVAAAAGVTAISGTPTFWRQGLWRDPDSIRSLPLVQITLGGEPVDQAVLDQLRDMFPQTRVSWIYASSEAGASIAVHDGMAGFPVEWLDRDTADRPRLSVVDDELVLTSPHHAVGLDGPIRTGDRVEIRAGRVHIIGRIGTDEINVGGSKVSAGAVRTVLLAHPAVAWAQVRGRKAPIVGTLVQADLTLNSQVSEAALTQWCADRLPDYAVPRRFRVLPEIPIKETLKSDV